MKESNFSRRLFIIIMLVAISKTMLGQLLNNGFEDWTNGNPDAWVTNNDRSIGFIPVKPSTTKHSGSFALEGIVTLLSSRAVGPQVLSGWNGEGFAIDARYTSLHGYYKYSPVGEDKFYVYVVLLRSGDSIGAGSFAQSSVVDTFSEFIVNINYVGGGNPDLAFIGFGLLLGPADTTIHVGTTFFVDDLSFSGPAAVTELPPEIPTSYTLSSNYPNPFNPSTTIEYVLPKSDHVTIKIYDLLGREIKTLVNQELEVGQHRVFFNGEGLPGGMYYYRIQTPVFFQTSGMVLLR